MALMNALPSKLHRLVNRIERAEELDQVGKPLAEAVRRAVTTDRRIKDTLSGTWLGHPLHPLLTDIPIGCFTSTTILDLIGGRKGRPAADALLALGLISAVPTAAAGASDWSDTIGAERRVGVVHVTANTIGLGFYAWSFVARRRGERARGSVLALLGMGAMTVGGYLGGHLSFARGIGVNHTFNEHAPEDWTAVMESVALPEAKPAEAKAGEATVMLCRVNGSIHAIGNRCSHAGGPLAEGTFDEKNGTIECPWHCSVFRIADGSVVHGPATSPQPSYDVRVQDGKVEVRHREVP